MVTDRNVQRNNNINNKILQEKWIIFSLGTQPIEAAYQKVSFNKRNMFLYFNI